ncbi:hypothetical protein BO94DRAFT_625582 [Aspergillus sclerotioniger CBS 115572]|uniref:Proteinase inhibitor I78 n=1 Tax=Aspergillus sclerotioniger CBS 115572 TaxID=1450535 RepID=A0A317WA08_9EURO|nr:hypothetical protein BO94DRAFT_625582 [Aspergillus sclerotioniger CBS 115572]PWY83213.1 hypothetical protein BO94DRAFT_625582 [Aspergillus sclerotioniger CBS 115572]
MPLVVPGINSAPGPNQEEWLHKLAGKKITESDSDVTSFAKKDLPEGHRVIKPGDAVTMDFRPERMNVHVDDEGIVQHVSFA